MAMPSRRLSLMMLFVILMPSDKLMRMPWPLLSLISQLSMRQFSAITSIPPQGRPDLVTTRPLMSAPEPSRVIVLSTITLYLRRPHSYDFYICLINDNRPRICPAPDLYGVAGAGCIDSCLDGGVVAARGTHCQGSFPD